MRMDDEPPAGTVPGRREARGAPSAIQISVLTCSVSGRCHILAFFPLFFLKRIYLSERASEGQREKQAPQLGREP